MRITTLLSATTIALAAVVGSVSAADQFETLNGLKVTPIASSELDDVKGTHRHFFNPRGGHPLGGPFVAGTTKDNDGDGINNNWFFNGSDDGGAVAPSYRGLCRSPAISIPNIPSQCP